MACRRFALRFAGVLTAAGLCAGLACPTDMAPAPFTGDLTLGVTLRLINNSALEVVVDLAYHFADTPVRVSRRVLAPDGPNSSDTVVATHTDRIRITAMRAAPTADQMVLAEADLMLGRDFSLGDTVEFVIPPPAVPPGLDLPPIADAGPDQVVPAGARVTLNGSNSRDPLNQPITFLWRQIGGPVNVALDGAGTATPSFVAPPVTTAIVLSFELIVSDGALSASDSVDVLVQTDCNHNGVIDATDIATGFSRDCQPDGIPDECQLDRNDCNANGVPDSCEIRDGAAADCNANGVPDFCDIRDGTAADCNENGVPDECDVRDGPSGDCNANGVPDECEDCNGNRIADECDIDGGTSRDCNANRIPDECEPDCNGNGVPDDCDIAHATSGDCNLNKVPDECDLASGTSQDCNENYVPDECDIAAGTSYDCNENRVPDECDLASGTSQDCNENQTPDECDIAACQYDPACMDCNNNGVPDGCDLDSGFSIDCDENDVPDECDPDGGDLEGFLEALLGAYGGKSLPCHFDPTQDGEIDGRDIGPFIERYLRVHGG